jgi:cell division protein FtsB
MKHRLAILVLGLLLAGLQWRLWVAEGGVVDTRRLQAAVDQQAGENEGLKQRNGVLEAEVADLRAGGAAIEAHARRELGMIRKGEVFYLVVEPSSQPR